MANNITTHQKQFKTDIVKSMSSYLGKGCIPSPSVISTTPWVDAATSPLIQTPASNRSSSGSEGTEIIHGTSSYINSISFDGVDGGCENSADAVCTISADVDGSNDSGDFVATDNETLSEISIHFNNSDSTLDEPPHEPLKRDAGHVIRKLGKFENFH